MTLTFKQEKKTKITINECPFFSCNKEIEIVDFYILLGKNVRKKFISKL